MKKNSLLLGLYGSHLISGTKFLEYKMLTQLEPRGQVYVPSVKGTICWLQFQLVSCHLLQLVTFKEL
jgi:hypothetical protein